MADPIVQDQERIEIELAARLWLDEPRNGKPVRFEGHALTRELSIGGTFVTCQYLLPVGCPINVELSIPGGDQLSARGVVAERIAPTAGGKPGMDISFTAVDAENRERLLRFFVSDRVRDFYEDRFKVEFPHLGGVMSLQDVALVVNLWEDKEGRLTSLRTGVGSPAGQAPRRDEARGARKRGGSRA
jgi:hypothetical protein